MVRFSSKLLLVLLVNSYCFLLCFFLGFGAPFARGAEPSVEEIRAEADRFIDVVKREGATMAAINQASMQEFLLRSRERAFDIAIFAAHGEARDFNELNAYLFERYALDYSARNSIVMLIDALSEASKPQRQERQVRSSYGDVIDGVMWTTGALMIVRVGLRLSKVGTFARVGRLAQIARGWVYRAMPVNRNLPSTIFARPDMRVPWQAFQQLSAAKQLAIAAGLGAAWGLTDFTVYHLSTEFVDPAPVLEALQGFLAYQELALPICGLGREMQAFERNTVSSLAPNSAPPEAVAESMRKHVAEVRRLSGLFTSTRVLAPHLMEARTVANPEPGLGYRFASRRQDQRYDVSACRAEGPDTVALAVIPADLSRLANIGLDWQRRFPQAFPKPQAPAAPAASGSGAAAPAQGANSAAPAPAAAPSFRGRSLAPTRRAEEPTRPLAPSDSAPPSLEETERALLPALPGFFSPPQQ